jgi:hypothetical protein
MAEERPNDLPSHADFFDGIAYNASGIAQFHARGVAEIVCYPAIEVGFTGK